MLNILMTNYEKANVNSFLKCYIIIILIVAFSTTTYTVIRIYILYIYICYLCGRKFVHFLRTLQDTKRNRWCSSISVAM